MAFAQNVINEDNDVINIPKPSNYWVTTYRVMMGHLWNNDVTSIASEQLHFYENITQQNTHVFVDFYKISTESICHRKHNLDYF